MNISQSTAIMLVPGQASYYKFLTVRVVISTIKSPGTGRDAKCIIIGYVLAV